MSKSNFALPVAHFVMLPSATITPHAANIQPDDDLFYLCGNASLSFLSIPPFQY